MKTFYLIMLFFLVFQMSILVVGATGIFPYGFYSDMDPQELAECENPQQVLTFIFDPEGNIPDRFDMGDFTIPALIGIFIGIGTITSIFLQSYLPITIVIIGLFFVPMITHSYGFFNQLFYYGNSQSIIYLGLLFGILAFVIAVVTIIELPAQGRS